ncbi:hypothetical protein IVG45_21985 [Methylomonas sp. LL1]|uniref:hypothetical protein n=1 Tax=Methylomonas sp. LL1 TaxID=2785785 RepID=UPI0018C36A96|nr:hypothetical protein [Methylomonas sp. LL1]QPK63434.1 hypothetical protein IVG45_21985 [Methylomonas sp. LL1]
MNKAFYIPCLYLGLTLICFWPGLSGPFLLDDFGNLDKLGNYNGVRNLDTFIKYLAGGIAGPTGRPLSLLSFLVNGTNWPTDPFPFKLTNVLLHGLCGIFLYLLCQRLLLCFYKPSDRLTWAAMLVSAAWLLHPFLVSTVLYVVQRMAMLSAFFSIVGLWLYTKGRRMMASQVRRAYGLMSCAIVLFTLLAILSKENGVLLPLLIACVEICVFRHPATNSQPLNKIWQVVFLALPSLAVFAYLAYSFNPYTLDHPFHNRDFTLPQRLMTESRLVAGYLYHLFIPQMFYPGLLNENIQLSTGLLTPISTIFSILVLIGLLVFAILKRHRWPLLSLGIVFFFAGHLLESTTLGLELYFEHRNYLPAIFLFLPFGSAMIRFDQKSLNTGIILFLTICALFTYQRSKLWGNSVELTLFWAQQNPDSSRAQRTAALELENAGHPIKALELLDKGKTNIPSSLDLQWHWFILKCQNGGVSNSDIEAINQATGRLNYTSHAFNILQATIQTLLKPECKGVTYQDGLRLLESLLNNPAVKSDPRVGFQMHHLKGLIYATIQQPELALAEFDNVLSSNKNIEHGLVQVGILASHKHFEQAMKHLNRIEPLLKQEKPNVLSLNVRPEYSSEINRIKQNLQDELNKK